MDDDQQFCLRWNNHQSTLISVFDTLLENETLVDCTLAAEGKFLKAHKVVLSACSPYFATLLQEQYDKHPIFILKDVKFQELRAMMDYMYRGEVNISQDQLAALLKAAESLQIKGLSDNRQNAPKPEHHRAGLNVPVSSAAANLGKVSSGYTLEQTKRARIGGSSALEAQDITASREGSSSPSRRRRKVRRRSIENAMGDIHDNSNSSQIQQQQQSSLQQQQQSNVNLAGIGAIAAAAPSALGTQIAAGTSTIATSGTIAGVSTQGLTQQLTTNVTKKTESVKGTSDAMNTDNVQAEGTAIISGGGGAADEQNVEHKTDKTNHKQKLSAAGTSSASAVGGKDSTELIIEPKNEYDEECNDETVEDLTLDDDMGMEDLDQNAGTSQGGEGSSQGYGAWQHDRSQDDILLATQDAQQRDPQDLSRKLIKTPKENTAPQTPLAALPMPATSQQQQPKIHAINSRSILNTHRTSTVVSNKGTGRKHVSVDAVSNMLLQFYKANTNAANAKTPKTQQQQQTGLLQNTFDAISAEALDPSGIIRSGVIGNDPTNVLPETASKNLLRNEMVPKTVTAMTEGPGQAFAPFHSPIKYTDNASASARNGVILPDDIRTTMTAIPTSVVVPTLQKIEKNVTTTTALQTSIPTILPHSVIKPVPATDNTGSKIEEPIMTPAVLAAAIFRDGYQNLQQQLRAQELLKQKQTDPKVIPQILGMTNANNTTSDTVVTPTKLLENFLRQNQRDAEENDEGNNSDTNDGDDEEDDLRYNGFDDIHLMEATGVSTSSPAGNGNGSGANDYLSDESQKFITSAQIQSQSQALRNMDYTMSDFSRGSGTISPNGSCNENGTVYECRHCGKKYAWKSTLRRHESVECGGKEPSHKCPHCPYKAKQRGNLGVHVRKHHPDKPQLTSKRRSKYSVKNENGPVSANTSDDSSSRLIIDCSK